MHKNLIKLVAFLTVTTATYASANGPYVGAFAGGTMRKAEYKLIPISPAEKLTTPSYNKDYKKYGFLLGAYLGYGKLFNNFYLGGEGSIHYEDANGWKSHTVDLTGPFSGYKLDYKTQYKRDWVFGLGVRLGTMASANSLVYIKPAIEISRDKFSVKETSLSGPGASGSFSDYSVSKWKLKFAPTVGFEYFVRKNLGLRLEYAYSFAINNKDLKIREKAIIEESNYTAHTIKIGLTYNFQA